MEEEKELTYESISGIYITLFKTIGFYPRTYQNAETRSIRGALENQLIMFYCHCMVGFYYTIFLSGVVQMILQRQLGIHGVCEMVLVQGVCTRYLLICVNRRKFIKLLELCKKLWIFLITGESKYVKDYEKISYYLLNVFLWGILLCCTVYLLSAYFITIPSDNVNDTAKRTLPITFYVDVQEDPWYTLTVCFQATITYSLTVILSGIETAGPFFVMMACGYLNCIRHRLLAISQNDNCDKLSICEINKCVEFHQKVMEFCEKLSYFMRGLFMVTVSTTVYNMSLIGIKILENDQSQLQYLTIFTMNLTQFFICQWIPEHLISESKAIGAAAYSASLSHRNYNHKANRVLLLMMLRAAKPVQLTAGGYVKLSLETFQRLIMSAFSMFTVLRSFYVK